MKVSGVTTIDDLMRDLIAAAPEVDAVLQEYLADNDELLPHLLFGDVTRWLDDGGPDPAVLAVLDHHIGAGDDVVQNVLAASFLENLIAGAPGTMQSGRRWALDFEQRWPRWRTGRPKILKRPPNVR